MPRRAIRWGFPVVGRVLGSIPRLGTMGNNEVSTPLDLIMAIEERFGPLTIDLAANENNHKTEVWCGPGSPLNREDALAFDWNEGNFVMDFGANWWLNNPYDNTAAWVKKCHETITEPGAYGYRILQLIPAAVCTNYVVDYINEFAYRIELTPRPFKDEVRDCMLIVWTPEQLVGRETWKWRE